MSLLAGSEEKKATLNTELTKWMTSTGQAVYIDLKAAREIQTALNQLHAVSLSHSTPNNLNVLLQETKAYAQAAVKSDPDKKDQKRISQAGCPN